MSSPPTPECAPRATPDKVRETSDRRRATPEQIERLRALQRRIDAEVTASLQAKGRRKRDRPPLADRRPLTSGTATG